MQRIIQGLGNQKIKGKIESVIEKHRILSYNHTYDPGHIRVRICMRTSEQVTAEELGKLHTMPDTELLGVYAADDRLIIIIEVQTP